ncbi:elongation factor G [Acidiferrimicrobium sp. IK]|uniref:elongation factor G n=1 Tax=Acidiferrimicrobium sp. IK TaxID=2871700 RepID=UPI0021CB6329|nr:elongation factor G [Acidiferrimicrobium sp. IK]MCU4184875.1 elongation factor G [Acidiferrimicrobium sp. IK]
MLGYPSTALRNVVLVGHNGSGKTTLCEALLHLSGTKSRPGRVEDGTTVSDFEPEEQRRGMSLSTALVPVEWQDHKLNILDTPGTADFIGETAAAMGVADLAVFVVSAVEGVEVQTEALWRMAADAGLPRMIYVNKLDRDRASFDRTLEAIRSTFGAGVAPLELPIGEESAFRGVIDLLSDTAVTYDGTPTGVTGPVPDDMAVSEHAVHDALVEGIVVADDELMERYLEGDVPSVEQLEKTLAHGVASGQVFPVLCGSATVPVGVDRLATLICEIGPSPLDRPGVTVTGGDQAVEVAPDPDGPPLMQVWKTVADRHVGRISLCKVLSGTIAADATLVDTRTHSDVRVHAPFSLRGHEQLPVSELACGDLAALAKLTDVATGDTLAPRNMPVSLVAPEPPRPVLAVGIRPKTAGDDDKLMTALHRLAEEDPTVEVRRDDDTHQTLLVGMGETHLAVAAEKLARKFGVEIEFDDVVVPYRETIGGSAQAEGKYKKQTGGHGQYGVATLLVEPLEPGGGFEFVDRIVGGAIPKQFIPAVQKGVEEAMASGGVHGHPVVDVRVTCLDGKYHPVDSSEMSFKMAGAMAFREALEKAGAVVLEPVSMVEVTVPDALLGEVMGDLNTRRGRVQGSVPGSDGQTVVTATVPAAELTRYAVDLRSLSGGRASFTASHDHYDRLPAHLWERVKVSA